MGLLDFPLDWWSTFLAEVLLWHSRARGPSFPHLKQAIEHGCGRESLTDSLFFSSRACFPTFPEWYWLRFWSISTSSTKMHSCMCPGALRATQALYMSSLSLSWKQLTNMSLGQLRRHARSQNSLVYSATSQCPCFTVFMRSRVFQSAR